MIANLALMFLAAAMQQPSCEALKALSIPNATITAAEAVAAGAQPAGRGGRGGQSAPLPAHCRVAVTLKPSSDSHIEMELWMPAETWNGKFLAVGNGGWAGNIETNAIANGLRRGYATASNDTGHRAAGGPSPSGHPKKVAIFDFRPFLERPFRSKTLSSPFNKKPPIFRNNRACSPDAL